MYLHVGNHKMIRACDVIGIFDMDHTTVSAVTRKFLKEKEKQLLVEIAAVEIPKSFVLYLDRHDGQMKICFSQLSTSALLGRMEEE